VDMRENGYELFRRAVVERDADAWGSISINYRGLLMAWAARSNAREFAGECCEDLADEALARAWAALTPDRFDSFPSLAALLAYLRTCVAAAVIDAARGRQSFERALQPATTEHEPSPEYLALARLGHDELWRLVSGVATTEAERVVMRERYVFGLQPRCIQARHPDLFPDVRAVYSALRNTGDRLRRNKGLRGLYDSYDA
jgi:DNA-directed RNA polymerase specialized sigma24 family protein